MVIRYPTRIAIGIVALASLGLGGCETNNYDEQIATLQSQVTAHDGRLGALEGKVSEHDARLAKVEKGKFNYQKVGEAVILFDTGSYTLKPEEAAKLDAALERLKAEDRNAYIEIEGFADLRGGEKSQSGARAAPGTRGLQLHPRPRRSAESDDAFLTRRGATGGYGIG